MKRLRRYSKLSLPTLAGLLSALLTAAPLQAQELSSEALEQIRYEQKLDQQLSLDLPFVDENGSPVRLGDYFDAQPVLIVLGYYSCPMLCSFVLNGLVTSLQDLKAEPGADFQVVYVSIDPADSPESGRAQKEMYLHRYGRPKTEEGWHFLTGDQTAIDQLADEVGFRFAYDSEVKQYAHPSGFVLSTSEGRVARYFLGVKYAPAELAKALRTTSAHEIGSPVKQLFLLCFHYNPITGKYGSVIMTVVRLLGVATMVGIGFLVFSAVRRNLGAPPERGKGGEG